MALITCPECGKQVSSEAAKCIHCGYPISQRVTVKETVVNSDALPGVNFSSVKKASSGGKSKTVLIAIVLIVALAAGYFFVINPMMKKNSLKFPYGLEPEMSLSQATQVMRDKGFKSQQSYSSSSSNFSSREVFGKYTDYTSISVSNGYLFCVDHMFAENSGHSGNNPSTSFLVVCNI